MAFDPDSTRFDAPRTLWARRALDPVRGAIDGALLSWKRSGIVSVEPCPAPPPGLKPEAIYDSHLLTPGLLNAHCHLDYSWLAGELPGGRGFAPWLAAMIESRKKLKGCIPPLAPALAEAGVRELIEGGAVEVWDIDSLELGRGALAKSALRRILFREWISPDPARWESQWAQWLEEWEKGRPNEGISAHSLYSVCAPALEAASHFTRVEKIPFAIHLSESDDEIAMLMRGSGAMADIFSEIGIIPPALKNGLSPIAAAARAYLLRPSTLAIHCNRPAAGDADILAQSGAVVVFCPGSHAFFGYPPYPLKKYLASGVRLALGTDSLSSTDSLSMLDEARRLAALAPHLSPVDVLGIASGAGLGDAPPFGGRGRLRPGSQWALWRVEDIPAGADHDRLGEAWLDASTRLERSGVDERA